MMLPGGTHESNDPRFTWASARVRCAAILRSLPLLLRVAATKPQNLALFAALVLPNVIYMSILGAAAPLPPDVPNAAELSREAPPGKTVIRGGIGVYYENSVFNNVLFDRPFKLAEGRFNASKTLCSGYGIYSFTLPGTNQVVSAFGPIPKTPLPIDSATA